MSIQSNSLKNTYKSKVEIRTRSLSQYKNTIVSELASPFKEFEFYQIQQAQFEITGGPICIVNEEIEIWSNQENALEEVFNYLHLMKENYSLSISQVTFLHKILFKKGKQLLVDEDNMAPFEKMAKKHGFILTKPAKSFNAEEVHYNFWTYCIEFSTFIQNQIVVGKEGKVLIKPSVN